VLRRLEAMLAVADLTASLVITGNGDVLEPEHGIVAIGSGGPYAQAAARALLDNTALPAAAIVKQAGHRFLRDRVKVLLPAFQTAYEKAMADPEFRKQFRLLDWEDQLLDIDPGFNPESFVLIATWVDSVFEALTGKAGEEEFESDSAGSSSLLLSRSFRERFSARREARSLTFAVAAGCSGFSSETSCGIGPEESNPATRIVPVRNAAPRDFHFPGKNIDTSIVRVGGHSNHGSPDWEIHFPTS
jgi:hypothetical protein